MGDERCKQRVPTQHEQRWESGHLWVLWGTKEVLHPAKWDSCLLRHCSQLAEMMGNPEIAWGGGNEKMPERKVAG